MGRESLERAVGTNGRASEPRPDRSARDGAEPSSTPTATPHHARAGRHGPSPEGSAPVAGLIVADDAEPTAAYQLRKTDFLLALEEKVTIDANEELGREGRSVGDCPWISYWFAYYQARSVAHVVRALVRYAPEAARAGTVDDAIAAVGRRVARSVRRSIDVGRPVDVPPGVPGDAFDPNRAAKPPSGQPLSDPILGASEAEAAGPAGAELGLAAGQPLDNATRSRMETAFQADFSDVRLHTGARGQTASGRLSARAFGFGTDIGFAPGRHRPGTPVGDALLAHELAHVLQQRPRTDDGSRHGAMEGRQENVPTGASTMALEADANRSAATAVASLSGLGAVGLLASSAVPRPGLSAGLRISRCGEEAPEIEADETVGPKKTVDMQPLLVEGVDIGPEPDVEFANTRVYPQANMEVNQRPSTELKKDEIGEVIGEDLEVAKEEEGLSQEERDLLSKHGSSTVANTLYVSGFEGCDDPRGRRLHGAPGSMIVMTPARSKATFSHELGHLMGLPHRGGPDDLMTGSGTTDHSVRLNENEIKKIRASSYAR